MRAPCVGALIFSAGVEKEKLLRSALKIFFAGKIDTAGKCLFLHIVRGSRGIHWDVHKSTI